MTKIAKFIVGPTAGGKTALAYQMALKEEAVIINVDAMQIFKDIPILSASPSDEMKATVPHMLYNFLDSANNDYNISVYLDQVKNILDNLPETTVPIFVGGTGMYIKGLLYGIAEIPEINIEIRSELRDKQSSCGNQVIYEELIQLDPMVASRLNINDSHRILRALEVIKSTGKSLLYWQSRNAPSILEGWECQVNLIMPERQHLYNNCNIRFVEIIENGAIDEIKLLYSNATQDEANKINDSKILNALGAKEIRSYLLGEISYNRMIELSQSKTRQYAKRQCTWFRHNLYSA